jgi:galactitol-specific phosphotransferase system IIB component
MDIVIIGDCVYTALSDTDADIDFERIEVKEIKGDDEGSALTVIDIEADDDVVSVDEIVNILVNAGDGEIDADGESV